MKQTSAKFRSMPLTTFSYVGKFCKCFSKKLTFENKYNLSMLWCNSMKLFKKCSLKIFNKHTSFTWSPRWRRVEQTRLGGSLKNLGSGKFKVENTSVKVTKGQSRL